MIKKAQLSADRKYRFSLWRIWDEAKPTVLIIGLNPSTADEIEDDPTIRRCINLAKSWGYGGVCMGNLFAYRTKDPTVLKKVDDPIGKENNDWLLKLSKENEICIAAWGNQGSYLNRSEQVRKLTPDLHFLKMNKSGEPAHPLYLQSSLKPVHYSELT